MVTSASKMYHNVPRLFYRWLQDHRPQEMQSEVPFTSIAMNSGYAAKRHRDSANEGPSAIKAFGNFSNGGELLFWPDDDRLRPLQKLRNED